MLAMTAMLSFVRLLSASDSLVANHTWHVNPGTEVQTIIAMCDQFANL